MNTNCKETCRNYPMGQHSPICPESSHAIESAREFTKQAALASTDLEMLCPVCNNEHRRTGGYCQGPNSF